MGISLLTVAGLLNADTQVAPELALKMLNKQNQQFEQRVVQTASNVFTAVGFHGANTSMIVGDSGVIIVDTLMGPTSAAKAFEALRKHSDKPVKAIIYTHSHGDHTGGASVFAAGGKPVIYAMDHFGTEHGTDKALNPIMVKRGIRQFGRKLPAKQQTNRGLAPAKTFDKDRGKGYLKPTHPITDKQFSVTIAGIDIELHAGPGETDDALFVWLPKERVLFSGDNFYQTFPNLYAIRGTAYRNVLNWADSVNTMASFEPAYLIPGHTLPLKGEKAASQALLDYSQAISSVYEQTIKGINAGKSPNLIAHEVELPQHLKDKPYLTEFYGTVPHSVRAIYAGLLGWFDGNPATLNPLSPKSQAQKVAQLAGGTAKLTEQMQETLQLGEYQWALQLGDYLKWLNDSDKALVLKGRITALRGLAAREYNAPNRNYYLSYANELEAGELSDGWD